jgi:nicotinamide mononucleotide (NMN) deamidase PncC
LSETGAAGPTGNRYGDDAGHTCVAVSGPVEMSETLETGKADRAENMELFGVRALEILEKALNQSAG